MTVGDIAAASGGREMSDGRGRLTPMLATSGDLPTGDNWCYEIKWDGIRVLATIAPSGVQLITRNGNDVTRRYPELWSIAETIDGDRLPLLLDGEIVAFDDEGRPSFHKLQSRMNIAQLDRIDAASVAAPVHLALFDVLVEQGRATIDLPYVERRRRLEAMSGEFGEFASVPATFDDGQALLDSIVDRDMEGVLAKTRDGLYRPGIRSSEWIKVKSKPRQEFVVGGWTAGKGAREGSFGALLLGFHPERESEALRYAGNVGSGFSDADLADISPRLRALERDKSPFDAPVAQPSAKFVRPSIVVEVEFQAVTPDGRLRHPVFKGVRTDKDASDVVLESARES